MTYSQARSTASRRGSASVLLSAFIAAALLVPAVLVGAALSGDTLGTEVAVDTTAIDPPRTERLGAATLYGIENGFGEPELNRLHVVDPATADILSSVPVTLPGMSVLNCTGLAIDPTDGEMFAIVRADDDPPATATRRGTVGEGGGTQRMLIRLNRATGIGTLVGELGIGFAGLAFKADGTLIGITGDGGSTPETLFEIDKANADTVMLFTLGNGDDGEAIACHQNGLLYHASGIDKGDMFFESVDLDSMVVTDHSNPEHAYPDEVLALGYSRALDAMFRTDRGAVLTTIDIVSGETTFIGLFPDDIQMKGLAFDEVLPPPGEGGVLENGVRTIFLERGPALGISPMNVVYHPEFQYYYASNGGDPLWSAWVYDAAGNRIQDLESLGVDVRAWNYNPNIVMDNGGNGLEILSFDAQDGDGGNERGLIHPGTEPGGLLNGETTNVLAALPGLIDRQSAPSYDPDRNVFYSRGLGTLVHVVDRDTGVLVDTFDLDFEAAGVVDTDVLAWSLGYDPELRCLIAADHVYDRALVFELDGTFVGASAIDMDIHRMWGVAYTNGQFFIWSDERNGWQGYLIKVETDPCDDCPCPADINRNGEVEFMDIVELLAAWGPCSDPEQDAGATDGKDPCDVCPCPADINRDGVVDFQDNVALLAAWGPCDGPCYECPDSDGGCPADGECVLAETIEGGCVCVLDVPCEQLTPCFDDGACPEGFACCISSCCEEPICVPLCGF